MREIAAAVIFWALFVGAAYISKGGF